MNYTQLSNAIQDYAETTESLFVANIPNFVKIAEERIYNTVQIPAIRRNVTGYLTANNKYLTLPSDYLATFSLAVIDPVTGAQTFMLDKDVNFIRQAYPGPTDTGTPAYFGQFAPYTLILGPTPDASYQVELHEYYYPPSIVQGEIATTGTITPGTGYTNGTYTNVQLTGGNGTGAVATVVVSGNVVSSVSITNPGQFYGVGDILSANTANIGNTGSGFSFPVATVGNAVGTSWVGDNYESVLLYGALREAVIFQKGEQDMVNYYEQKYQESLALLVQMGDGYERRTAYRDGQKRVLPIRS